jgi:hypothetical protein
MGLRWDKRDPISRQRPPRYQAHPNDPKSGCAMSFAWAALVLSLAIGVPSTNASDWQTIRATWYGGPDGLLGETTMCGQTLTTELWGVAHWDLGCGATLDLRRNGQVITVPVLDRSGGGLDLMPAVKRALGCGDICVLEWRLAGGDGSPAEPQRQTPPPPGPAALLPATDTTP